MSDLVQRPHSPHWARAEPVQGETLAEWRANAKQGALYRLGDVVLAWVNEGDLYSPNTEALVDTFGQQLHGALSGVASVVALVVKEKDAEIGRLTAELGTQHCPDDAACRDQRVRELAREIERLTAERALDEQRVADLMADLDRVAKERDALRAALMFYADEANWQQQYERVPYGSTTADMSIGSKAEDDGGERARAAIDAQIAKEASNG